LVDVVEVSGAGAAVDWTEAEVEFDVGFEVLSEVVGFQYRPVCGRDPLWFMRSGRRFGVVFCGGEVFEGWIANIDIAFGTLGDCDVE
jgi:hypothetical protein